MVGDDGWSVIRMDQTKVTKNILGRREMGNSDEITGGYRA
jgi:hypothetical protein